jgi:hypothetical protein
MERIYTMKKKLVRISLVVVVAIALIVQFTEPAAGWNSGKAANPAGTTQVIAGQYSPDGPLQRAGWNT